MTILAIKGDYSNYLEKTKLHNIETSETLHRELIDVADKLVDSEVSVKNICDSIGYNEEVSYIVKEDDSSFYYLRHSGKSAIAVIFDIDVTDIIEIVVEPKLIKKDEKDREIEPKESSFIKIVDEFISNIKFDYSMQELISSNASDELYFINKDFTQVEILKNNITKLTQAVEQLDREASVYSYLKTEFDYNILSRDTLNKQSQTNSAINFSNNLCTEIKNRGEFRFYGKNKQSILAIEAKLHNKDNMQIETLVYTMCNIIIKQFVDKES